MCTLMCNLFIGACVVFALIGWASLVVYVVDLVHNWLGDRRAEKVSDHLYLIRPPCNLFVRSWGNHK